LRGGSYEEAIAYYNKVIEQEPTFADAWLHKGICMLRTSKIGDLKTTEAISSWKAAIKFAKNPNPMKKRVAKDSCRKRLFIGKQCSWFAQKPPVPLRARWHG
jgi:tetratricopeptide (TPR) repeat protein